MLRGATRGVFLNARQIRRAANAKSARRSVRSRNAETLVREESVFSKQQQKHSRFGRADMEMIPKALTIGAVDMMNPSVIDALNLTLEALIAEDDDGR